MTRYDGFAAQLVDEDPAPAPLALRIIARRRDDQRDSFQRFRSDGTLWPLRELLKRAARRKARRRLAREVLCG